MLKFFREYVRTSAALLCFLFIFHPIHAQTERVDALLAGMTLEQKVGQMFMVTLYGAALNETDRTLLQTWQPGGVVLLQRNAGTPAAIIQLTNSWQQAVIASGGLPLLISSDQEMGIIMALEDPAFTRYPVPMLLTATASPELAQRTGAQLAVELRSVGVNINLAPVADLDTNLDNPIIGRRAWGSTPAVVNPMLTAFISGMQAGGVMATVKHFPGHGDTADDSHTTLPLVPHDRARLDSVELAPFRAAIESGVSAVMVGHLWLPVFEHTETPASLSYNIVTGLLREELGFDGVIITDALDMGAIQNDYGMERAGVLAVSAGVDLVLPGPAISPTTQAAMMQAVVAAVRAGEISENRIDESARRVLHVKERYGVLDWQQIDPASSVLDPIQGERLVGEIFRAGVTIATDDANLLPLNVQQRIQIVYPGNRQSIYTQCSPYAANALWVSISDTPTDAEIETVRQNAQFAADVTVVFTQNAVDNARQSALVNALPPERTVVTALVSPYDWREFPEIAAYVLTYSPLPAAYPAACAALFTPDSAPGQLAVSLSPNLPAGTRAR